MSRTKKGAKAPGWELWAKRPFTGWPNAIGKKMSTGVERQQRKRELLQLVKES